MNTPGSGFLPSLLPLAYSPRQSFLGPPPTQTTYTQNFVSESAREPTPQAGDIFHVEGKSEKSPVT